MTTKEDAGSIVLGFGPKPMDWIARAAKFCSADAIICSDVARMAGATFAFGPAAAIATLRSRLEAGSTQITEANHPGVSFPAVRWLATGERGTSSEAMFTHLTGIPTEDGASCDAPYDVDDMRRCRLLLEQVPELQPRLADMASASPVWSALLDDWAPICTAMDRGLNVLANTLIANARERGERALA